MPYLYYVGSNLYLYVSLSEIITSFGEKRADLSAMSYS